MRWIHEVTSTYLLQDDVVSTSLLCVELRIFTHWTRGLANQRKRKKEWDFDGCVFKIAIQSFFFFALLRFMYLKFSHTHIVVYRLFSFHFFLFHFLHWWSEQKRSDRICIVHFVYLFYLLDLNSTILSVILCFIFQ